MSIRHASSIRCFLPVLLGSLTAPAIAQDSRGVPVLDAVGSTPVVGGVSQLRIVDLVTGATEPYMSIPAPPGFGRLFAIATLPGNRLIVSFWKDQNTTSKYFAVDPLTGTITAIPLGAPLTNRYTEGLEWSPRHNAILITYGNYGTFATTSVAIMNESGTILGNATATPAQGDLDEIASDGTRDLFFDLNRTASNRVVQLATLFPAPTFANFATPPSTASFWDAAIHPVTGKIYFIGGTNNRLVELVGNTYVNVVDFQDGVQLEGFAIGPLPPRIHTQPSETVACEGGAAVLTVGDAGGSPLYRWRRLVSGLWVDLADGPTGTGSTISGSGTDSITISNFSVADEAEYSVRLVDLVTAPLGIESDAALVHICPSNYNCDGLVDILDFLDFLQDFADCEGEPAPCGAFGNADRNGDTGVDILDFLDFLDAFGNGC